MKAFKTDEQIIDKIKEVYKRDDGSGIKLSEWAIGQILEGARFYRDHLLPLEPAEVSDDIIKKVISVYLLHKNESWEYINNEIEKVLNCNKCREEFQSLPQVSQVTDEMVFDIDCGGSLKLQVEIKNNRLSVTKAMDGWGLPLNVSEFIVSKVDGQIY